MKIPIKEAKMLGGDRYLLQAYVVLKGMRFLTTFIVDTGSPWSIIMESDLKTKTRIHYTSLKAVERVNLIYPIDLLDFGGDCILVFKDSDGNLKEVRHKMFGGMFTNRNIDFLAVPSFLGKDFLDAHNFFIGKKDEKGVRYLED